MEKTKMPTQYTVRILCWTKGVSKPSKTIISGTEQEIKAVCKKHTNAFESCTYEIISQVK